MKNELFCSRLARIRAHTPRRAKMKKILTRILKRACKRFNIEREDLFDAPDSSARSKSSPREPVAEGDENVDALALDTTKRCTNGHPYLVKTYKGRVETEPIKEDLVKLGHGLFNRKIPEKNYSTKPFQQTLKEQPDVQDSAIRTRFRPRVRQRASRT